MPVLLRNGHQSVSLMLPSTTSRRPEMFIVFVTDCSCSGKQHERRPLQPEPGGVGVWARRPLFAQWEGRSLRLSDAYATCGPPRSDCEGHRSGTPERVTRHHPASRGMKPRPLKSLQFDSAINMVWSVRAGHKTPPCHDGVSSLISLNPP